MSFFGMTLAFTLGLGVHAQSASSAGPHSNVKNTPPPSKKLQPCELGIKPFSGTFKASKVTLVPRDPEEGGDCNQAHVWIDAIQLKKKKATCSLSFGVYLGDADKDTIAKKMALFKAGPFSGSVDPAGMCYPEFKLR